MALETLLKLVEGTTSLNSIPIIIAGYFIVKEYNIFNEIKTAVHKYESDIIILKKDIDELKKQLEKLDNEHQKLHPRKGGKFY